jgi:hypothetical protein
MDLPFANSKFLSHRGLQHAVREFPGFAHNAMRQLGLSIVVGNGEGEQAHERPHSDYGCGRDNPPPPGRRQFKPEQIHRLNHCRLPGRLIISTRAFQGRWRTSACGDQAIRPSPPTAKTIAGDSQGVSGETARPIAATPMPKTKQNVADCLAV